MTPRDGQTYRVRTARDANETGGGSANSERTRTRDFLPGLLEFRRLLSSQGRGGHSIPLLPKTGTSPVWSASGTPNTNAHARPGKGSLTRNQGGPVRRAPELSSCGRGRPGGEGGGTRGDGADGPRRRRRESEPRALTRLARPRFLVTPPATLRRVGCSVPCETSFSFKFLAKLKNEAVTSKVT